MLRQLGASSLGGRAAFAHRRARLLLQCTTATAQLHATASSHARGRGLDRSHLRRNVVACHEVLELPSDFPGLMKGYIANTWALALELMEVRTGRWCSAHTRQRRPLPEHHPAASPSDRSLHMHARHMPASLPAAPARLCLRLPCPQEGSLSRLIRKQLLTPWKPTYTPEAALGWCADVAAGLAHLHSCARPVVHRDVKMCNIMLRRDPAGSGRLVAAVTDLGLHTVRPAGRACKYSLAMRTPTAGARSQEGS